MLVDVVISDDCIKTYEVMDGTSDTNTKRLSIEELSKDELIARCKSLLAIAQKAKLAKDVLIEENNKLKEQLGKQQNFSSEEIIEKLTKQKVDLLTALEELKSKKLHLDNKLAHCETRLHDAEHKISELDTANQSYKRRVDRLSEENEQLITHLDELEKQIEELKTVGLQQQQQLLALEKNNILLAETNDSINEKLQKKSQNEDTSQVIELENKLSIGSEEIKYLKSENSQLNGHLQKLEKILKSNEENLIIKDNELSEKIKIIEDLKLSHAVFEKSKNDSEINMDKMTSKLQNEFEQSQKEVDNLKEEIYSKNKEIEKNINIVDDLKTELHKNKALVEKLQQDVVNMNNKLTNNQIMSSGVASDLQNANEKLKEKLKLYHSKIVKFASDIKYLKQTKIELVSTFKMYTSQVSDWKEKLHLLLERIECQDRENEEITLQNKSYREAIGKEVAENKKLQEELKESEKYKECLEENEELKDLNKSLKEEINLLQQKLTAVEIEILKSGDKYLNVVKEKDSLEESINKLQEKYNNLEKEDLKDHNEYTSLKNELEFIKCQYEEKIKEIENHEAEKIKFIEQNKEHHENSQKLIEENNKLEAWVNDLNSKVSDYGALQERFQETQVILKSLKEELSKCNIIIENNKKEIEDYRNNHASVIEENQNLEKTLKDLEKEYNNLEKINLKNENESDVRETQSEEQLRKMKQECDNIENKLLLDLEKISSENHELRENINKYLEENKELIVREENLKSNIDVLNKQCEEFKDLQKKYKESESFLELLTSELRKCKETMDNFEKLNSTLQEDLNCTKDKSNIELLTQIKKNDELVKVVTNLEKKLQKITNETSSFSREVQTIDIVYNFEERISSLKRENTELLSEMNEMNQALKERGETISNQEAYYEEMLKKFQNYEAQINNNREELITKDDAIKCLKEEISTLRTTNNSLNIENLDNSNRRTDEINHLKMEVQELRDKLLSVSQGDIQCDIYTDSENMSTSTISKTEEINRMKDLDSSWEERYGKLRNLALKLKGKIRDLTTELQREQFDKTELHQKHAKTIQSFQQQIDKLQDNLESSKNDSKQYLKKLDSIALDVSRDKKQLAENEETISQLKSEIDGLNKEKTNTDNWKKQVSTKIQTLKKEQEANNVLKKDFENKINKLNVELESKDKALKQEIERHNQTKTVLQESNNECKKQSVLNLEMQDYERSVKELSQKIDKKQELVNKLKSQLETQKTSMNTLKEQNQELEDSIKTIEDKYDKINSENEFNKKKITEFENVLSEKENKLQDLTYTIENLRSDNEDLSTQLSKTIAEHRKVNDNLKEQCDLLKSRNMGLEQSLREVQGISELKEHEFLEMQKEYQGYKVRAQSVLRQNQSRDVGVEEKLTEEAASLRAQVDILTSELQELRSTLNITMSDNNRIQRESEELIEKIKHLEVSVDNHKKNYEELFSKHQQMISEHTETIRGLKIHSDTLAQCYRQQLSEQESRHNREIIELQSKMDRGNTPPDSSLVIPSMPREEGEGSESVDSITNNGIHPIPLEKLLSNESENEVINIKKQLSENESKVVHLTALLADTEQDLAKYVQLNKVLKEEIRRQQRSAEREKHAENLEYLKNVVFKFITLGSGDERSRLVPVLNTILKLSPEETQKLNNVARGEKGWSNYLPISWGSPNKPQ